MEILLGFSLNQIIKPDSRPKAVAFTFYPVLKSLPIKGRYFFNFQTLLSPEDKTHHQRHNILNPDKVITIPDIDLYKVRTFNR